MHQLFRQSALIASLLFSFATHAETAMPATIKLVVPYPPGGSVDTVARYLQQPLQEALKTTVIVDNRPGAGGRIAASQVKREPADGSVVLIAPNALTTIQSLVYAAKIDYSITEDFKAVSKIASYPFGVAVPASSSVKNASDLSAWMKANSANAAYGTSGAGGMSHFSGLVLGKAGGFQWNHIGYKGGAPMMTDLIGGHIPAGIDTLIDQIEQHRANKIRVIGLFSNQRYPLAPEIPTLAEQGVKVPSVEGWFGAFVPAKTPADVVARIDQAIGRVLSDPQMKARMNKVVIEPTYLGSSEFTKYQAAELQQWAPVVKESGFKPE